MDRDINMEDVKGVPELDTSLMPIFQKYKQENESWIPGFDVWDYLNLRSDFDMAAAFTKLFWPDFVEVDGCVLLKGSYSPENFKKWMSSYEGDRRAVESMMNHLHLWDTFLNSPKDVEYPEQLHEYLVNAVLFGWKQVLHESFPDKRFVFTIRYGYGPEISFHQVEENNETE